MTSSGILYDSSWSRPSGTVWLDLPESLPATKSPTLRGSILPASPAGRHHPSSIFSHSRSIFKSAANLMLLIGGAGVLLTMLPVAAMEAKYQIEKSYRLLVIGQSSATNNSITNEPITVSPPGPASAADAFSISIPKISANSVIIPNVDPADPKIYAEALKTGVAHALGTGLPGVASRINRTIYLFAHSTSLPAGRQGRPSLVAQYNAQFYLLNKLEIGDEINITFWAQNYKYRVAEIKITEPSDVSFLTPQTAKEILVLATCTPPGTTWKRLIVLAEPIEPPN